MELIVFAKRLQSENSKLNLSGSSVIIVSPVKLIGAYRGCFLLFSKSTTIFASYTTEAKSTSSAAS